MNKLIKEHIVEEIQSLDKATYVSKQNHSKSTKMVSGFRKKILNILIKWKMLKSIIKLYRHPLKTIQTLNRIIAFKKKIGRNHGLTKFARVGKHYYWDIYTPGFRSVAFEKFVQSEANRMHPQKKFTNRFLNVIISITNKCSYKCEHCYEWDFLNKKDDLPLEDIINIVQKFQNMGTTLIHFSGGEPMLRVDDMIKILESADKTTQFWIATSGYQLDLTNAKRLKEAGLTGVTISLDDIDAESHNKFRGYKRAFDWVQIAINSCIEAGLVTALSTCIKKEKVNETYLMSYMNMAKEMGVAMVQILEPKAVGHYNSQDIELERNQEHILDSFYHKLNFMKGFEDYPVIIYHGHHQRKMGCFSAGDRVIYVDSDGDINPCPFCKKKGTNALNPNLEKGIELLRKEGCNKYEGIQII